MFGEETHKPHFVNILQKLKLKYYNLMIQLDQHEGSYLSICKHYRAIYDTPCIQAESEKWQQVRIYSFFSLKIVLNLMLKLIGKNLHFLFILK